MLRILHLFYEILLGSEQLHFFDDLTTYVSVKQCLQNRDPFLQYFSNISISYRLAFECPFYDHTVRMDISFFFNSCLRRFKRIMRRKDQSIGIIDQRVSCNSGFFLVRF